MNRKVINAHCHIYPAKVAERATAGIRSFYGLEKSLNGMTDGLIEDGKKVGCVHYLVHSVATNPDQVRSINDFIADEVRFHKGLFTGFGTLHPDSTHIEEDIGHLINNGLRGIKIHPDFQGFSLDGDRAERMGRIISRTGLPVLTHCGDPRYEYSNPKQLSAFLDKFPDMTVIGAHLGGWSKWDDVTEYLGGHKNLYVDCSSCFPFMDKERAESLIRFFGADRVLWGTDYPMWEAEEEMRSFDKLNLSDEEKELILYKNVARLLKLGEI